MGLEERPNAVCELRSFRSIDLYLNILAQKLQQCFIASYSFLTNQYLLLAVFPSSTRPAREGDDQIKLAVCDIERTCEISEDRNLTSYAAICELHLPPLDPWSEVAGVLIRTDPPPHCFSINDTGVFSSSFENACSTPVPFSVAPYNRLFVITLAVFPSLEIARRPRDEEYHSVAIFVPFSTFLPFISPNSNRVPEVIVPDTGPTEPKLRQPMRRNAVKWSDWIPNGTRMLILPSEEQVWVCNVFGSRYVYPLEPRNEDRPTSARHFAVMDFNGTDIRKVQQQQQGPESSKSPQITSSKDELKDCQTTHTGTQIVGSDFDEALTEVNTGSTIESDVYRIFTEDVTTNVPYRCTVSKQAFNFDGVMITEDNIVLVKVSTSRFLIS